MLLMCRLDVEPRRDQLGDESNDSSVADPETEGHSCCCHDPTYLQCFLVGHLILVVVFI